MEDFNSQNLANTAWALAKAKQFQGHLGVISSQTAFGVRFATDEQHKAAAVACDAQNAKRNATIATKVLPAKQWWDAEEYHQDYFRKNRY